MNSPQWKEFLQPLLSLTAFDDTRKPVQKLDDAFEVANHHAEIRYANYILNKVQRKAEQFLQTKVSADPQA